MSEETVFVDGMFYHELSERVPDFVLGKMSFKVDEFVNWLQSQKADGQKFVSVDVLRSKSTEKAYCKLNTFVAKKQASSEPEQESNDDELPF